MDLLERIRSEDPLVRNRAAIEFIDYVADVRSVLVEQILEPKNKKIRGSLVYALNEVSCLSLFVPLFSVLLDSGFEVAMHAYGILTRQEFDISDDDRTRVRELFENYLVRIGESEYDFEEERKERTEEVLRRHIK